VTVLAGETPDPDPEPDAPTIDAFSASVSDLTATFTWSLTASAPVGCTVNFGDGSALQTLGDCLGTQTITHTYDSAGTYTATLALTSGATATTAVTLVGDSVDTADCGADFVITNQSDLEALSGCGVIGSLTIDPSAEVSSQQTENDPIASLAPLAGVTGITRSLVIANTNLETLAGLEGLVAVGGDITISGNDALLSLAGLENIAGYDDANTVQVIDNSSLDCSQPTLPFSVDISQGNAVDCTISEDAINSVRFLAPLEYLPNLNIFVPLTAGISQRITIERYGRTADPLTVQVQVLTPPSTIAVEDIRINGNTFTETFEVTFPATRSRTTFDLRVVGDALDEATETLALAFVETPDYGLVEPAELRFDVQKLEFTPEPAPDALGFRVVYNTNPADPHAIRIDYDDGSSAHIYANRTPDGRIIDFIKIDHFDPGSEVPVSFYFDQQRRIQYIKTEDGSLTEFEWQSDGTVEIIAAGSKNGEGAITTESENLLSRQGTSQPITLQQTLDDVSTVTATIVTCDGEFATLDDVSTVEVRVIDKGFFELVPMIYNSAGVWIRDVRYFDGFPSPIAPFLPDSTVDMFSSSEAPFCQEALANFQALQQSVTTPEEAEKLAAVLKELMKAEKDLNALCKLDNLTVAYEDFTGTFLVGDDGKVEIVVTTKEGKTVTSARQSFILGRDNPGIRVELDDPEDKDCVTSIELFDAIPRVIRDEPAEDRRSFLVWRISGKPPSSLVISSNSNSDGIDNVNVTDTPGELGISVTPEKTTIYTLEAKNSDGEVLDSKSVEVKVISGLIANFTAVPDTIRFDETSTLTWEVVEILGENPITLTIEPEVGDVSGRNSVTVSPTETTTYILTATNDSSTDTATATVTVEGETDDNVDEACQDCIEGSNIGDPRYRTFDGLFYEFQGVGEYILVESLDDDLVIQTRQAPWRDSTTVSINSGVAAQVGADRVGIYVDQASELYINGEPTELASGERRQLDGGSVRREDNRYTVMLADQTTLVTSLRSDFMDLRVLIAPERASRVAGLLGDANGSRANDLATREGSVFEQPLTFEQLYGEYGNSWRISQEESLLDYLGESAGIGTAFYTDFNFPSTVPTVTDEALAFAEEVCNAANITDPILLEACILDVAITGDASFAEGYGEISAPDELLPPPEAPGNVQQIAAGGSHSLAITADGNLWAWGSNFSGQLGDGTNSDSNVPVRVAGLSNVQQIAAGDLHSLAITADGNLWAWGFNFDGQLGDGTNTRSSVPVRVAGLSNVQQITAGSGHSLAITADGNLWAWGVNLAGQLGGGTNSFRSNVPVRVAGLSNVQQIAAGGRHSLAITADGNLWAWGYNLYGQLGNGTNTISNVPVRVAGLSNVQQIAAGLDHSLAITADGNLWAWGYNLYGQLGNGTDGFNNDSNVHVRITGLRATQQTSLVR
jgi:hypothetical protein